MEGKKKIVLDASVITKWYSEEPSSNRALEYRQRHIDGEVELLEPTLLLYEVANALNYNPNFGEGDVKESMEALVDVSLSLKEPEKETLKLAVNLARKHGISIYDASYIALSMELGCHLVTADKGLWRKAKGIPYVRFLVED